MAHLAKNKGKQKMEIEKKRILVTFDIDGTLLKGIGKPTKQLQRQAYYYAFAEVFGLQNANIEVIPHHGQTDPFILVYTLVHYGLPYDDAYESVPELKEKMLEYCSGYADKIAQGLEVLPGVISLLQLLSANGVTIGLATGDFEDLAWLKLEALGLRKYFSEPNFGAFGDDHMELGDLVIIAGNRAKKLYDDQDFDFHVHVGDTPNDIRAAEFGGAFAVGVCTGVFAAEDLMEASNGNAIILPDLNDTRAFLKVLGIY